MTSYIEVSADDSKSGTGKMTMKQLDDLATGNTAAIHGKMRIVDISRSNYSRAGVPCVSSLVDDGCGKALVQTDDCLGIVPVVVSPVNALYFQDMLSQTSADADEAAYNPVGALSSVSSPFMDGDSPTLTVDLS